jgi:methyl-accepting chemotaxis protein
MLDNALPEDIELDEGLSVQVNAMRAGKRWGSLQVYYTEDIIADKIRTARKNALSESEKFKKASQTRLNRAIISQTIGIFVILVILILCLTISLRYLVLSPLKMVSDTARRLAEFDLTVRVDTRRQDEIGMMFVAVDHMVAAFRKIVSDVKSGGRRLAQASGQMKKNIVTIASAAEEMSTGVREISKTTGHMSQNMNAVAGAIEEMSASINKVGETARRGSDIAKDAVLMAEKAGNTMSLLGDAANRIGEVTEVIKRIADKTALLALNADIEAASAGKAGKGFAVVANEIKSFARQSTRAADEIAARILLMQKNTGHAVSVIGDVSGIIHTMNSSSETISSALEEQMTGVKEIAANAVQADTRAKDIAASMIQLAQGANDVSIHVGIAASGTERDETVYHDSSMDYMDTSAAEVERLAGELLELVDKFKMD